MEAARFWIALIVIILFHETLSVKKGYYTIVAPGTIRPESPFHISFTLNDFHKSCWYNVSLKNSYGPSELYEFNDIEVQPGTTKLIELKPPLFNTSLLNLEIIGYRGIISQDSSPVYNELPKTWAFIQTNKPKYKPGDVVKFRIIYIDQLKKPGKFNGTVNVKIFDADYNLLGTYFNIKFIKGVFKGLFQISEYPVLGQWRISIHIGDQFMPSKFFQVERYLLPKFYVKIDTKPISIYDEEMEVEISANYFYGEPVKGNLSLFVTNAYQSSQKLKRELRLDGNIKMVFDLKNDLQLQPDFSKPFTSSEIYKFYVEAIVTDFSSEEQSWTTKEIPIYSQPYKIEFQAPKRFDPAETINAKVQVLIKDLEGNIIKVPKSPIEIKIGCGEAYNPIDFFQIEYKKQAEEDFAVLKINNRNYSECFWYAEYEGSKSETAYIKKRLSSFYMDILTESPEEGKELKVKITNMEPIEEFSYEIVSKDDIIQSEHVIVPGNEKTYILSLQMTNEMVPKITIYIHLIHNSFVGEFKDVVVKKALLNSIEIKTDHETKPGKSVRLNVTTDEGSYVGLMALDRSALENIEKMEIFNEDNVNSNLASVNSEYFYNSQIYYGRSVAGVITFSNAFPPSQGGGGGGHGGFVPIPSIRKHFPESWLFQDFVMTPAGGLSFLDTTPDSITTWAITGFSIHPKSGLSFTKNITDLKVFQQFFISFDLPSLVKEGEIIEVPIYIINYMDQDVLTNVTIETDSEDLELLNGLEGLPQMKQNISKLIPAASRDKILYFLKPLKIGQYSLIVKAISPIANDAVQKTLNVQSQGIPYSMSKTFLVHLPEDGIQEDEITIDIPENAIPGSQKVQIAVVGDIFRPLMGQLVKHAKVPYGNGEENMRFIISNCLVLKYIKALNYSNKKLEQKILLNLRLGYQNQLSFKYLDGSFGLFDRKIKRTGDIWQTALALWGLKQANEFIQIDFKAIEKGFQYLKSKQLENGCLESKNSTDEDVKVTAFGMMVFLTDQYSRQSYKDVISKGLSYLNDLPDDDLEYSTISLLAEYVLFLANREKALKFFQKLVSSGGLKSKKMLKAKSETLESHLETTAASLINLFETQNQTEQIPLHIVKGLIVSSEEESSINHLIALEVMMKFMKKFVLDSKNLNITFNDNQNQSGVLQVNSSNYQVLQSSELSGCSRKVNVQSKGQGFAVVDVKYQYNLLPENQSSSFFAVDISTKKTSKYLGVLKICSSLLTNETDNRLYRMEVDLQSGYIFSEKDSKEVEGLSEDIKSLQINGSREKLVAYFEFDNTNEVCIELEVRKSWKVYNSKPGWVFVYDANDKDRKSAKSFKFDESM
ncbi:thioester-containing protein 1 allele R1-like [Episyrphus balteatus]|uniref:thioester-containing protein 1 allele R1-like n=1 Tax=Episyrphus balteatus TaxID=286459 RepID=UPI002485490F|nr:thioester-containing protein 1 allele R1-like [Episyrphus balteatus]